LGGTEFLKKGGKGLNSTFQGTGRKIPRGALHKKEGKKHAKRGGGKGSEKTL